MLKISALASFCIGSQQGENIWFLFFAKKPSAYQNILLKYPLSSN